MGDLNGAVSFDLGYDPRPGVTHWHGTAIPRVEHPVPGTAAHCAIAARVWWQGDPWTVLRNSNHYLWAVMNHGRDADALTVLRTIPRARWLAALDAARPGRLAKRAYIFWTLTLTGRMPADIAEWPDNAHRGDLYPMRNATREQMYERHRIYRERRLAAQTTT